MGIVARLATLAGLGSLLACAAQAPRADLAKEEAAIRQRVSDWNGYLTAHNDSAITALYGDDGVMMPPGQARLTGSGAIRTFWATLWPMKAALTLSTVSVRVAPSGDLAVEEGNWDFAIPSPAGDQKDHGKYLVVWSRATGSWKVAQDIWNSDQQPPAPPPAPAKGN